MHEANPLAVVDSVQDTDFATGVTATGPAAGTAIATIASAGLPAGRYRIRARCSYVVGTPAAADDNNIEIRKGSTAIGRLQMNRVINNQSEQIVWATLDGTQAISLNVVGNATAGVAYSGVVHAERLGAPTVQT